MTAYIDPGVRQGAVVLDDGTVYNISRGNPLINQKKGKKKSGDIISFLLHTDITEAWIEQQWARPHDGISSAFNNGYTYGSILAILRAKGVKINIITPNKWQKPLKVQGADKSDRKKFLRDKAKELFPNSKVTLENCDAFLIMNYVKGL